MSIVVLASGGLDSTLIVRLALEEDIEVLPLFIDYGQLAAVAEWQTCRRVYKAQRFPRPHRMSLKSYGRLVPSGLTNRSRRIHEDAFLPGRNLLLLVAAAGYAYAAGAAAVAIGILREADHLFPDQTREFLTAAEEIIQLAHGRRTRIVAPLMEMSKSDVVQLAQQHGLSGTYSCHKGGARPCGECISCVELLTAKRTIREGA